jgi:hypothetical protein
MSRRHWFKEFKALTNTAGDFEACVAWGTALGECFLLCQGAVQATVDVFDSTLERGDVKPAGR